MLIPHMTQLPQSHPLRPVNPRLLEILLLAHRVRSNSLIVGDGSTAVRRGTPRLCVTGCGVVGGGGLGYVGLHSGEGVGWWGGHGCGRGTYVCEEM